MFKFFITKHFDGNANDGSGGLTNEELSFSSTVKDAFNYVLKELSVFAEGVKKPKSDDATVSRFAAYLSRAKEILDEGIVKNLMLLKFADFNKESALIIACFLSKKPEGKDSTISSKVAAGYLISQLEQWLKEPTQNSHISAVLQLMADFNFSLDNKVVREIIETV
jgi:hypothetical protein